MTRTGLLKAALCMVAAAALSACGMFGNKSDTSRVVDRNAAASQTGAIGVNAFLWRAALDTLNFMPLESADPFGGIIITGWHADAATPNERFKATVYILDTRLRADALNVSVFRQTNETGTWADAAVNPDTEAQIENAILTRARQLRLSAGGAN